MRKRLIYVTTVAPETDGAIEFIRTHADKVKISLGHTGSDYETCMKAFEAGATQVTHLFNAMPPLHLCISAERNSVRRSSYDPR